MCTAENLFLLCMSPLFTLLAGLMVGSSPAAALREMRREEAVLPSRDLQLTNTRGSEPGGAVPVVAGPQWVVQPVFETVGAWSRASLEQQKILLVSRTKASGSILYVHLGFTAGNARCQNACAG